MTRTAADVQAEIDALADQFKSEVDDIKQQYDRAWVQHRYEDAVDLRRRQLQVELRGLNAITPLERERDDLARKELDAATHPAARLRAMRLRAAYRAREDLQVLTPGETWSSLPLEEARAWAAVEREAARL